MNLRYLPLGIVFAVPAAAHAQSTFNTFSTVSGGVYRLPYNERVDFAYATGGGANVALGESSAATAGREVSGASRADLANATMAVPSALKTPGDGLRHQIDVNAGFGDTLTFERTGRDVVIPMRFELDGALNGGEGRATGDFTIFDGATHVPVFRLLLDTRGGRTLDLGSWTIPASSSGLYGFSLQLGATSQSDAPGGPASTNLTARLKWDLSAGYTSASGVFKPASIAPVPEPASMVALGIGAVGLLRRRRRG